MPEFSPSSLGAKIPQISVPAKGASRAGKASASGRQEGQAILYDRLQGGSAWEPKGKNLKTL